MVPERAAPNEKWKKLYSQSLMGPYEASQTRINNSTTFFLPAAPFHWQFCSIWRIRAEIADMVPERAVHNEKWKKRYPQSLMGPYEASQTRINNSTTFFLPAAPFHWQFCNIWRIRAKIADMAPERAVPNKN